MRVRSRAWISSMLLGEVELHGARAERGARRVAGQAAGVGGDADDAPHPVAPLLLLDPGLGRALPLGEQLLHAPGLGRVGRQVAAAERRAVAPVETQPDRLVHRQQMLEDVRAARAGPAPHQQRHVVHRLVEAVAGGRSARLRIGPLEQLEGPQVEREKGADVDRHQHPPETGALGAEPPPEAEPLAARRGGLGGRRHRTRLYLSDATPPPPVRRAERLGARAPPVPSSSRGATLKVAFHAIDSARRTAVRSPAIQSVSSSASGGRVTRCASTCSAGCWPPPRLAPSTPKPCTPSTAATATARPTTDPQTPAPCRACSPPTTWSASIPIRTPTARSTAPRRGIPTTDTSPCTGAVSTPLRRSTTWSRSTTTSRSSTAVSASAPRVSPTSRSSTSTTGIW